MNKKIFISVIILLIGVLIAENVYLIYKNNHSTSAFVNHINEEMYLGLNANELEKDKTFSADKGPRGDGTDVSIYKVKNDENLKAFMKKGPDKNTEAEISNVFSKVKYSDNNLFSGEYYYYEVKKDENLKKYYLLYSPSDKKLYIIRDLV